MRHVTQSRIFRLSGRLWPPAATGGLCLFFLLLLSSFSQAQTPEVRYVKIESGELMARIVVVDSLPAELVTHIDKGVPVQFQYEIGLWRERAGWFDEPCGLVDIIYKVRYDPWEKEYSVVLVSRDLVVENNLRSRRETLDLVRTTGPVSFGAQDTAGIFYLAGELTIKTMSFSNFKEVESWLKGGVSNIEKPRIKDAPDKLGEFVFDLALKVSGFKNISRAIHGPRFRLSGGRIEYLK